MAVPAMSERAWLILRKQPHVALRRCRLAQQSHLAVSSIRTGAMSLDMAAEFETAADGCSKGRDSTLLLHLLYFFSLAFGWLAFGG